MTTPPTGGRRRVMDGPRRKPASPPAVKELPLPQPAPEPAIQRLEIAPPAELQPSSEEVYEYKKPRKWKAGIWRWTRRVALVIVAIVVLSGGYLAIKSIDAVRHIIVHSDGVGGLVSLFHPGQLKGESSGRVNILVLGIGGQGHDGPNLTDTMMVWSLDTKTNRAAMISVPRDLYVKIPGHGYGKINSANALGGPTLSEQVVENVTGIPIDYYAILDFSGFKQAVDAVGGVDINVQTPLYDPYFPCDDGTRLAGKYCPINFKVGEQHMDGEQALEFSRSRETSSDFARAARQQQVLLALRQKALQLSTLSNPIKLGNLIDAAGGHLKTDLQLANMERLAGFAQKLNTSQVTQKVIDTTGNDSLLINATNTIPGAGSIELPRAGEFDYADVQSFVQNIFSSGSMATEHATVQVENGTSVVGLAASVGDSLAAAGLATEAPINAPAHYAATVIYDYTGDKIPYTIKYLENKFGVKVTQMPPQTAQPNTTEPDVRIILGSNYQNTASSQ